MIIQKLHLKKYDWRIVILYQVTYEHLTYILKILDEMQADRKSVIAATNNISANLPNTGFIYSNYEDRQSLIVIGKATSAEQLLNTISHEVNHLEEHIGKVCNVEANSEEACHLVGYVMQRMGAVFKKIICK